jgi:hypothetical protein
MPFGFITDNQFPALDCRWIYSNSKKPLLTSQQVAKGYGADSFANQKFVKGKGIMTLEPTPEIPVYCIAAKTEDDSIDNDKKLSLSSYYSRERL